jgi:hypothetical protein
VDKHPSGFKSEEEDGQPCRPAFFPRPREDHVARSLELEVLNGLLCAGQVLKQLNFFLLQLEQDAWHRILTYLIFMAVVVS